MAIDRFQANDRHPDVEVPHGMRGPEQQARPPSDAQRDALDAREAREADERTRRQADDLPLPPPSTASTSAALAASLTDLTQQLAKAQAQLRRHAVELEHARHLLDSERERFRELFEVASEGHIITDVNGLIREANRTAGALLNLPVDYLVGKPFAVFVVPADRRAFRVRVYRARVDGAEEAWTVALTPRDGEPMRALVAASPLLDARGNVTGLRWLIRDVSNRRAGVVWERTPAAILRSAIDALSTHVAVVLADGTIVTVNRAWRDAESPAGLFDAAGAGSNYLDLCDRAIADGHTGAAVAQSAVLRVLQGEESTVDALYSDAVGTDAEYESSATDSWYALRATRCEGPEPPMAVVTHEDVTSEHRAHARERALFTERTARSAAEAASRAKSEFLATLSHELRTPLNAIGGYAQLLEMGVHGPVTGEQAEDLRRILRAERHLLGLINELLNSARIERGDVASLVSPLSVRDAVTDMVELIAPQATARSIATTVECADGELIAMGDADKLRQVLLNLLTNAVKFTPAGGTVQVKCFADEGRIVIAVRDTGIGIPHSKQAIVFDPFVQVHRGSGSTSEGVGLGLAISRGLAHAMGGDLTLESEPGVGSTFELSLSRAMPDASLS